MTRATAPLRLGPFHLPNRTVMAPVKTGLNLPGGRTTEAAASYYRRLAEGGVSVITLEPAAVAPEGAEHPRQLRLHEPHHTGEIARLVDAIHQGGALAMVHLNHAGRAANPKVIGHAPLAPTAIPCPATGATATPLSGEQLEALVLRFGEAARRAAEAGADLIELQAGHGYLLAQTLSPRTNAREDRWGTDRTRFAREVLNATLAAGLPVVVRVSGSDFVPGGLGPAALGPLLSLCERAGVIAIHVGAGDACEAPPWYYGHMSLPEGPQDAALAALRDLTSLPLIAAGRMGSPARMEAVLSSGHADLIALGRPLIADPDLPRKLAEGREAEVLQCGGCLQACLKNVKQGQPISCIVNDWIHQPAAASPTAGKVLVAGSGPAGIAAALALKDRGADVLLVEAEGSLGGQYALAVRAPGKAMMGRTLKGLLGRLERSGVEVRTHTPITAALVATEAPDAVVLATGSRQAVPPIPGLGTVPHRTSLDFFAGSPAESGRRVLVVGAGMIGTEVAMALLDAGREVVAVELLDALPQHVDPMGSALAQRRLDQSRAFTLLLGARLERVGPEGATVRQGEVTLQLEPFDEVILATGMRAERGVADAIQALGLPVHLVGDATGPSTVEASYLAGLALGRALAL
ncbi:MAG: FAD-dependent oxidoreductase [Deltaproteobacteria bacterium]|nr:FAD-dependent oxidoreductase [Deltaproteobacteria bacterium]